MDFHFNEIYKECLEGIEDANLGQLANLLTQESFKENVMRLNSCIEEQQMIDQRFDVRRADLEYHFRIRIGGLWDCQQTLISDRQNVQIYLTEMEETLRKYGDNYYKKSSAAPGYLTPVGKKH